MREESRGGGECPCPCLRGVGFNGIKKKTRNFNSGEYSGSNFLTMCSPMNKLCHCSSRLLLVILLMSTSRITLVKH